MNLEDKYLDEKIIPTKGKYWGGEFEADGYDYISTQTNGIPGYIPPNKSTNFCQYCKYGIPDYTVDGVRVVLCIKYSQSKTAKVVPFGGTCSSFKRG